MMVPTQNVCAAEEPMVLCIIRDLTNSETSTRFNLNFPASKSCRELIEEVGKSLGYEPDSFLLTYEKPEANELCEVNLDTFLSHALHMVCTNVGNGKRNNFTVMEKDGMSPIKIQSKDSGVDLLNIGASTLSTNESTNDNDFAQTATVGPSNSTETSGSYPYSGSIYSNTYSSGYSYSSVLTKSDTGYVGLVNQAMTCYLNSLLQTLYMTPEFRNAVYRWGFDGVSAVKNIPYQLQRLFLQLQTSSKKAIETTDITKSFGWDSSEAWQQHDVQELMRVMFDALEKKWKNTDQADLINKLYQGQMKDYVKCLQCGNESARTDFYLDIPLTIRAFGSDTIYHSVNEALKAFVTPELLDGDNQYFCEKCNTKCDAHKGLKFISFPYLLTLQLKRFDFDYTTMHRIKLNDKMTFPEVLNINHLIETAESKCQLLPNGGLDNGEKEENVSPSAASCPPPKSEACVANNCDSNTDEDVDEGVDDGSSASGYISTTSSEAAVNVKNTKNSQIKGPYEYELYSIMIHSGSAAGGHYYAYIKSFKDGLWYSFNDQHVSMVTQDDIRKTYGGSAISRGYYSATYASSTNAYMLVYRQIDKENNEVSMKEEEFPTHLQDVLYKLQNREEEEKKQRELEKSTCKIKVFCFHPLQKKKLESKLEVHKDATLKAATEIAWKQFELDNLVPLDCVRLVKYDEFNDYIERSYDSEEEHPMEEVLDGVKTSYIFDLLLEVKTANQKFQEYRQGGITVKVMVCDIVNETIDTAVSVRAYQTQTIEEFKSLIIQELKLPCTSTSSLRLVLERYYNELKLLTLPDKTLKAEGFFKTNSVFVEYSETEDDDVLQFSESKFGVLLDRYEHTIRVNVVLPPFSINSTNQVQVPIKEKKANEEHPQSIKLSNLDNDEGIGDLDSESELSKPSDNFENEDTNTSLTGVLSQQEKQLNTLHSILNNDKMKGSACCVAPVAPPPPPLPAHLDEGDRTSLEDSESTVTSSLDSNSTVTSCSTVTPAEPANDSDPDNQHKLNFDVLNAKVSSVVISQANTASSAQHNTNSNSLGATGETLLTSSPTSTYNSAGGSTAKPSAYLDSDRDVISSADEEYKKYCRIALNVNTQTKERSLAVYVDKRITLKSFKKELEKYVGTTSDFFKVYKVYSNNQEFECTKSNETLTGYGDDCKLIVKLGRALKRDECRVKIFNLLVNQPEHSKFLTEVIIAKAMSVAQVRQIIVDEAKRECDLDIPIDRCRIRKKSWKSPSTIYLDDQIFDHDIQLLSTLELFVEILDGPELFEHQSQISIYTRHWSPSKHEVGPFKEVIVSDTRVENFQEALSELSGIPPERIEFARSKGTFPCEVSVLDVHTDLDWNPNVSIITGWPMSITDDGCIVYYRDREEELEKLTDEKKKELQTKENIRLSKYSTYNSKYSIYSRKERALKIYTDDTPVKDSSSKSSCYNSSQQQKLSFSPQQPPSTDNHTVNHVTSAASDSLDTELD